MRDMHARVGCDGSNRASIAPPDLCCTEETNKIHVVVLKCLLKDDELKRHISPSFFSFFCAWMNEDVNAGASHPIKTRTPMFHIHKESI